MYSREFIYEVLTRSPLIVYRGSMWQYLLNKKKELDRQRKLHEKQQAEATAEQQEKAEIARENELQDFLDSQVTLAI